MGSTNPTLNPHAIRKSRLTSIDRVVEPRRAATDVRSGAAGTNAAGKAFLRHRRKQVRAEARQVRIDDGTRRGVSELSAEFHQAPHLDYG